jgi:hypothetical protein
MIIKTTIPPVSILHQAKEIYREMSSETLPAPVNRHPALLSIMEKTVLLKALSAILFTIRLLRPTDRKKAEQYIVRAR